MLRPIESGGPAVGRPSTIPGKSTSSTPPPPPRSIFRQIAARLDKRIIYIPLASLSPVKLKKLRVFHVLHGHDKRDIAKDFVW